MATGDALLYLSAWAGAPPSTAGAQFGTMLGASTPAEVIEVANFDQTTIEYLDFLLTLPANYGGNGLTCKIAWAAAAATGDCVWRAALRRIEDDVDDLDTTAHTYDYNSVTATAPSVIGEVSFESITFTSGADMDSVAAGDVFILRVQRKADDGADTLADDARLITIYITET